MSIAGSRPVLMSLTICFVEHENRAAHCWVERWVGVSLMPASVGRHERAT